VWLGLLILGGGGPRVGPIETTLNVPYLALRARLRAAITWQRVNPSITSVARRCLSSAMWAARYSVMGLGGWLLFYYGHKVGQVGKGL